MIDKHYELLQEVFNKIGERAAEFGLTFEVYLQVAEENFYLSEPWLACKSCGVKILIDEAQKSPHHNSSDVCRGCGKPDAEAYFS